MLATVALIASAQVASAAESAIPPRFAGEEAVELVVQRFRLYADSCSASAPGLKAEFDAAMTSLTARIRSIAAEIMSSKAFESLARQQVPSGLTAAVAKDFERTKREFGSRDATIVCPRTLQNLRDMSDDSLRMGLVQSLSAVQNALQMFNDGRIREEPSNKSLERTRDR